MKKRAWLIAMGFALLTAAAFAWGCGSGGDGEIVIEVRAQNIRFVPETIEVPAGKTVTLRLMNLDETEHDLEVRGLQPTMISGGGHDGHGSITLGPPKIAVHTAVKKTATVEFRADQKGTYEVFCTISGHEQLGMVARLVVV